MVSVLVDDPGVRSSLVISYWSRSEGSEGSVWTLLGGVVGEESCWSWDEGFMVANAAIGVSGPVICSVMSVMFVVGVDA